VTPPRPRTVALLGRPNVGKSTLFNRLTGQARAIVDDRPGATRDRREGEAAVGGLRFTVVDTAGLEEAPPESLAGRMTAMSERAAAEADLRLLLIDARAGVTPGDAHFARWLRTLGGPTLLAANKCEGGAGQSGLLDAFSLGLGEPIPLSAAHGEGLADLVDALAPFIADEDDGADEEEAGEEGGEDEAARPIQIAILGRPNAGKSTLLNRLIGEDRALTGPEPGVTRDAIAASLAWRGRPLRLWDTAGLRRRAKVNDRLEKAAVGDALRAVRFAHVVILLADAADALEAQDAALARLAEKEGRAMVLALNKWDLVDDAKAAKRQAMERLDRYLPFLGGLPVVQVSAATGDGVDRMMGAALEMYASWTRRVPTAQLNGWLVDAVAAHPPPAPGGRRIKLRYVTQTKARPPTIVIFCQRADDLPESYRRYLVNSLRETFKWPGAPIRLILRKGRNPYAEKS